MGGLNRLQPEYLKNVVGSLGGVGGGYLLAQQMKAKQQKAAQQQANFNTEQQNKLTDQQLRALLGTTTVLSPTGQPVNTFVGKTTFLPAVKEKDINQTNMKNEMQSNLNLSKVVNLMGNLWAQKQGQLKETKGSGIIKGAFGSLAAKAKVKGYELTNAYEGQRNETALALSNILTGQNRVIKSLVDKILVTIPGKLDTEDYSKEQIAQSVRNAFGMWKAMQNAGLTADYLASLPDQIIQSPLSSVNQTISKLSPSALTPAEMKQANKLALDILSTPATEKIGEIKRPLEVGGYIIEPE